MFCLRALYRAADVVGERHDQGWLLVCLFFQSRTVHGVRDESDDFGRDPGHLLRHVVGILAIDGDEPTDDLRVIHMLSRLGLEAYSTACENPLTITVSSQYDIVVEYAKNVHVDPFFASV